MIIAFDLDETLGTPIITADRITGFATRTGAHDLLARLSTHHELILWTVSSRRYVDQILRFDFQGSFKRTITWDDLPAVWKDVRAVGVDILVDDSPHHRDTAVNHGIDPSHYIVIPPIGSPDDLMDPHAWMRKIELSLPRV